jgi:hypothetical protein
MYVEVRKDEVNDSLMKVCANDVMTVQVLEMLFGAFACKLGALVSDHLNGWDEYWNGLYWLERLKVCHVQTLIVNVTLVC